VGVADVLPIAVRHLDDVCRDSERFAAALFSALALFAEARGASILSRPSPKRAHTWSRRRYDSLCKKAADRQPKMR
jgi:hypothetical protein